MLLESTLRLVRAVTLAGGCENLLAFFYVTNRVHSPPATLAMENIQKGLGSTIANLSDHNYETSLTYLRFWFEVGQTYFQLPADMIFDTIYAYRASGAPYNVTIYPKTGLTLRLVDDIESDPAFAPHCAGFRSRFCAKILQSFFDNDMGVVYSGSSYTSAPDIYYVDVNYIAYCVNLGYIGEKTIRNHILQSLFSHTKMHQHQVTALAILFKLAGATFEAYADPAAINRCFEILNEYPYSGWGRGLIRVSTFFAWKHFRN